MNASLRCARWLRFHNVRSRRPEVLVDFDNIPAAEGIGTNITGNEWIDFGVVFSQAGDGLRLQAQSDPNVDNHKAVSDPNKLFSRSASDETIEITLVTAQNAIGFWILDSEVDEGSTIEFYDVADQLILSQAGKCRPLPPKFP